MAPYRLRDGELVLQVMIFLHKREDSSSDPENQYKRWVNMETTL